MKLIIMKIFFISSKIFFSIMVENTYDNIEYVGSSNVNPTNNIGSSNINPIPDSDDDYEPEAEMKKVI